MNKPAFSIVTPSFNALPYLKLCCASVADQQGIEVEHIVVDGASTDGTVEWLQSQTRPSLRWISEKDQGMYHAINKGLRMAQGELVAHLNCDEQYLPEALPKVARQFTEKKDDILFADAVVIDCEGRYVCSRKVLKPQYYHTLICHLSTFTAATFFRRSILDRYDAYFDESWKSCGDSIWMLHMLNENVRMSALGFYTSTFMDLENNLALSPLGLNDRERRLANAPLWAKKLRGLWTLLHRCRRFVSGIYAVAPFHYSIYTPSSPDCRIEFDVQQPTFLWKSRL